jgi:hypothetical protein
VKPRQPTDSVPMPETMSFAVGGDPLAVLSERVKRIGTTLQPHDKNQWRRSTRCEMCICSRVVDRSHRS